MFRSARIPLKAAPFFFSVEPAEAQLAASFDANDALKKAAADFLRPPTLSLPRRGKTGAEPRLVTHPLCSKCFGTGSLNPNLFVWFQFHSDF